MLEEVDLTNKTILVTGTTSGIGSETCRSLALKGAHVVMANRDVKLSEKLRDEIYLQTSYRKIDIIQLDLSSLESVQKAAKEFISKNWPLHVLILNAGVFAPINKSSQDGFEMTFGTNHLGHFCRLFYLLRENAPSRVVVVSSRFHKFTGISPEMFLKEKLSTIIPSPDTTVSTYKTYAYSKLCNVMFALELHKLENKNGINTYVLHPGSMIGTNIWQSWGWFGTLANFMLKPFVKSVEQGAETTIYCAISPEVENESGHYYEDCQEADSSLCTELVYDEEFRQALWEESLNLIKKIQNQKKSMN